MNPAQIILILWFPSVLFFSWLATNDKSLKGVLRAFLFCTPITVFIAFPGDNARFIRWQNYCFAVPIEKEAKDER